MLVNQIYFPSSHLTLEYTRTFYKAVVMGSNWCEYEIHVFPYLSLLLVSYIIFLFLKILFIFLERAEGRGTERERNIDVQEKHWLASSCMARTGPSQQPRYVPWPGIELATFQIAGRRPSHWATPVRALYYILIMDFFLSLFNSLS